MDQVYFERYSELVQIFFWDWLLLKNVLKLIIGKYFLDNLEGRKK